MDPAILVTNYSPCFRKPILDYIKDFAPPKTKWKLMKSCCFFYPKKCTLFPIKDLRKYYYSEFIYYITSKKICYFRNNKLVDIENKQICLLDRLELHSLPDIKRNLLNHVVVYELKHLTLTWQTISLNEFKLLTSAGLIETLALEETVIRYDYGILPDAVKLNKIFECVPKLSKFIYGVFHDFLYADSSYTLGNFISNDLNKLPSALKYFILTIDTNYPQFNYKTFLQYMQNYPAIDVHLIFKQKLSYFGYDKKISKKQSLQYFVDTLIKAGVTEWYPPMITFENQTKKSKKNLKKLRSKYIKNKTKSKVRRNNIFSCFMFRN